MLEIILNLEYPINLKISYEHLRYAGRMTAIHVEVIINT